MQNSSPERQRKSWNHKRDCLSVALVLLSFPNFVSKREIYDALKEVEVVNVLAYNHLIPFGTHYAALYVIVLDPYTRAPMLNLDIRQEVKIVKDPIVD